MYIHPHPLPVQTTIYLPETQTLHQSILTDSLRAL